MTLSTPSDGVLQYKPDWPRACERWTAFWDYAVTDRPCIDVKAGRPTELQPAPEPEADVDRYFDIDFITTNWLHMCERTYFGGEAVPTGGFFMGGYALGGGDGVGFAPDTVWHPVTMSSLDDDFGWHPGPDDPWRHKLDAVINTLLDLSPGRFVVGYAGQVPVNDLIYLLRGGTGFLEDLATDLDKCIARLEEMFPLWLENHEHFRQLNQAKQSGHVFGWPGMWAPHDVITTQSDLSCMISAEMFDAFVMREMDLLGESGRPLWYHVDGRLAKRHVAALCSRSYMRVIQYTPSCDEPPNGPGHLDFYRQVQAAGRGLDLGVPPEHVEFLIRHLRPEGVVLRTWAASPEAADELVDNAVKWCGSHVGRP